MATDRAILCGDVPDAGLPFCDDDPLRLDLFGAAPNVRCKIAQVSRQLTTAAPGVFLDLLDLAAYVYVTDQATRRGGTAAADLGADFRRRFFVRMPVRRPDVWADPQTVRLLTEVLSFLTEDEYLFDFQPLPGKGPEVPDYFDYGTTPFTGVIDDVVMFSGGLDSLGGAVDESVRQKRRVLLLNLRSTSKLSTRQGRLVKLLAERAGKAAAPVFYPVWANKDKGLNHEYTQRSRSFLFAALGATVATMIGRDRLRFYENGVVSLNLPLSAQVVGGRASRTTHPRVLAGLARLVTHLSGKPFAIENPFLWKTKTDVVKLIAAAGCADLIGHSTSCAHTWARSANRTHCGDCSQCIDRRFAVLAAGQEAHDPADAYEVDLFTGGRESEQSRLLLAGYLETANRVRGMDAGAFLDRFGEVHQVVRHVPGLTAGETGRWAHKLYRDHAAQVTGAIDAAIADHAAAIRERTLPETCLLSQVLGNGTAAEQVASRAVAVELPGDGDNLFLWRGMAWVVRFGGGERNILLPGRGATYLHRLLSNAGRPLTALELACNAYGHDRRYAPGAGEEVLDAEGVRTFLARCEELREELAEAKRNHDPVRAERLQGDLDELLERLRLARGLGGRSRRGHDQAERPRKAVGNAVRKAVKDILKFDARLAEHLSPPQLTLGRECRYQPPPGVGWLT